MWRVELDSNRGKVRSVNQDCWVHQKLSQEGEEMLLCGVADGIGGHRSGDVASKIAVMELANSLSNNKLTVNPLDALAQGFKESNQRVYEESVNREDCSGMGTTLTAALISGLKLFLGHVGDSRCYVYSTQGLVRLTHDHSLAEELVRLGGISPDDAEKHPQRHVLTRAMGIEPQISVDFTVVNLTTDQKILFCTDGLTRLVSDEELESILGLKAEQKQVVARLMEIALERGAPDNVTIMLVCWEGGAQ